MNKIVRVIFGVIFMPMFLCGQTVQTLLPSQDSVEKANRIRKEAAQFNRVNKAIPRAPEVKFEGMKERKLIFMPEIKFPANEDIYIMYELLLGPEGNVLYVKPAKIDYFYQEYLKGGVAALYNCRFNPLENGQDKQWVKAVFTFRAEAPASNSGESPK